MTTTPNLDTVMWAYLAYLAASVGLTI